MSIQWKPSTGVQTLCNDWCATPESQPSMSLISGFGSLRMLSAWPTRSCRTWRSGCTDHCHGIQWKEWPGNPPDKIQVTLMPGQHLFLPLQMTVRQWMSFYKHFVKKSLKNNNLMFTSLMQHICMSLFFNSFENSFYFHIKERREITLPS